MNSNFVACCTVNQSVWAHPVGYETTMSGRGKCYANVMAESFFRSMKNALIHHCSCKIRDGARRAILEYIEVFYQSLDNMSPADYERADAVCLTPQSSD